MTENKHTPCPYEVAARLAGWTVSPDSEFTDGQEIVGSIGPTDPDGGWATLCNAFGIAPDFCRTAAPDLLDNLKQLCEILESIGHDCTPSREAIDKAEGRA